MMPLLSKKQMLGLITCQWLNSRRSRPKGDRNKVSTNHSILCCYDWAWDFAKNWWTSREFVAGVFWSCFSAHKNSVSMNSSQMTMSNGDNQHQHWCASWTVAGSCGTFGATVRAHSALGPTKLGSHFPHFSPSELDPCLFIHHNCIIVLCVDDAIIVAHNNATLDQVQQELHDNRHNFNQDGNSKSYLGMQLDTLNDGSLNFSQLHLAKSLLDVTRTSEGAEECAPSSGPLFQHMESKPFDRSFNHQSAIGIPQYLGNNTRPDCSYAIHSCACYCIDPCELQEQAVKHIAQCVKATTKEWLIFKPNLLNLELECHVDADFAGN